MKSCFQSCIPSHWRSWFFLNKPTQLAYVQDTVHVGTKLRSRLLTPSIILALGRYVAGAYHLQFVQNTYSKDQHGLRERDVDCRDKQNFDSVLRITSSSVMAQISQIPDAYLCIELNAHALIIFMRTLHDHYSDGAALFNPWKLGSQSCEKTFRTVRSMTSTFSTVINVGMLGLLHRLQIQFRLEAESAQNGIRYPHCEKLRTKMDLIDKLHFPYRV